MAVTSFFKVTLRTRSWNSPLVHSLPEQSSSLRSSCLCSLPSLVKSQLCAPSKKHSKLREEIFYPHFNGFYSVFGI